MEKLIRVFRFSLASLASLASAPARRQEPMVLDTPFTTLGEPK